MSDSKSNAGITGGCACGAIRYRYEGEPIMAVNCHCRECQRATGSGYAPVLLLWESSFRLESGEPSYYSVKPKDPSYLRRGYCSSCGSPVLMARPSRPKLAYVLASSLDAPEMYQPTMNIFVSEAHSWDAMDEQLEKLVGMPSVLEDFGT